MTSPARADLHRLMAAMAAGDRAALFPFVELFGGRLAATVVYLLRDLERPDVAAKPEEVDYLVQSAAFVIFDRAGSWQPDGGALPWVWAQRAIRAEVVRWLGHPAVEWTAADGDAGVSRDHASQVPGAGPVGDDAITNLHDIAANNEAVALLLEAVKLVAKERDRQVHLEYQLQKGLGDRSPANTVAEMFGLTPANVRQIDRRVRMQIQALVLTDRRFARLAALRWWAA